MANVDSNDRIHSEIDLSAAAARENEKQWQKEVQAVLEQRARIKEGGGALNIEKQHKKNRLTARERIHHLIDKNTDFHEIGTFTAYGMYEEWGGAPAAGTVAGLGVVENRLCMIIANDATVKAGSFFPMTAKKVIRAQTIAYDNYLPTIYLVDSAGIFLPLQEDVFPDQDDCKYESEYRGECGKECCSTGFYFTLSHI